MGGCRRERRGAMIGEARSGEGARHDDRNLGCQADAKPHDFDVEDVEYLRHGDKPLLARVFKPQRRGPVSGAGRMPRRRLVPERPPDRAAAPRGHGVAGHRVDRARLPLRQRGPVPGLGAGHQLCGALGEAQCRARSRPGPTSSACPASRAAGIWRCWSPCGRTIRAMRRSRCRPARPRRTPACAA